MSPNGCWCREVKGVKTGGRFKQSALLCSPIVSAAEGACFLYTSCRRNRGLQPGLWSAEWHRRRWEPPDPPSSASRPTVAAHTCCRGSPAHTCKCLFSFPQDTCTGRCWSSSCQTMCHSSVRTSSPQEGAVPPDLQRRHLQWMFWRRRWLTEHGARAE